MVVSKQKSFPRGGHVVPKSELAAEKTKTKKKERDLFSISSNNSVQFKKKKKKLSKKKKSDSNEDDNNALKLKTVEPLTYDKLNAGFNVLARISEIHDLNLKLSLPGRLVASVAITKISQPYTEALKKVAQDPNQAEILGLKPLSEMFKVGQLVTCSIDEVEKAENDFFKVFATLAPAKVNENVKLDKGALVMAAVKAVEDHGFVMDLGKSSVKAFLPLKKAGRNFAPSLGQVLPCLVTKLDNNIAVLSCEPAKVNSVCANVAKLTVHNIHPGISVEGQISNRLKHGFSLKFGEFEGYINVSHLDGEEPEIGQNVKATVLYVVPTVNHILMSCQPDLAFGLQVEPFENKGCKVGDLAKNCKVIEADERGLTIRIGEQSTGIVPLRHLNEAQRKDIKSKLNTEVTVRVLQYDFFEQIFVCSMQKALLEQAILKLDQLKPGQKLTCKAKKFTARGLIVEVGRNLDGFIPHSHLADVPLKHPEKKFAIGDNLKVRVLKVNVDKRRLHLTHKRLLVETDFELVDSFDDKFVGKVTEGVVVQATNEGVLLELFNDICGWVPKSKISLEPVEYPEKLFFLGQVLKCKVLDVNPHSRRMTLTLILTEEKMAPLGSKEKKAGEGIKKGVIYENLTITDVNPEGLEVQISGLKAIIPKNHLTDVVGMADLLLSSYKAKDTIEKALCFEKDVLPILTLKASIMNYEQASMTLDDLHEGQVIPGIVSNIKPYGVFVKLPIWKMRKSSALIPLRHLSDTFVEDPKDVVEVHQTLYGKILEKNDKEGKLTLSAKAKEVRDGSLQCSIDVMVNLFHDLDTARSLSSFADLLAYKVGQVVNSNVVNVSEFGVETLINNGKIRGIITMSTLGLDGLDLPEKGQTVAGVITFIDYKFGVVELNVHPDIVTKAVHAKAKKVPREGQKVKASCVLKRSELHFASMVIKSPHQFQGQIVHVPTRHHLNDQVGFGDLYSLYEVYSVTIKAITNSNTIIGVLEKHDKGIQQKRIRKASTTSEPSEAITVKKARLDSTSSIVSVQEEDTIKTEDGNDPGWEKDFNPWGTGSIIKDASSGQDDNVEDDKGQEKKKAKTHLSKKEKKELDLLEELAIKQAEQRVVAGQDLAPESVDEFDKLVLSSPDSSLCWIQYMAFHVDKKEFGLAREVVKRALTKINFREEMERFNVYMAWFNMENQFGTEEEADKVLKEAVQCNDEFKVYEQIASIYMQTSKLEKAEKIFKILARKYNKEIQAWILLGLFYFKTGNLKEARFTLQRALQNLKKTSEIVTVTSKFAQFEFLHGESERGKTIFENIVRDFPSRIDQWSVYADMVVKKGEVEAARDIFERMINLGLGPKKMKSLFKKYWEFEQNHDASRVDYVRKKALEYLEKQNIKLTDEDDLMSEIS